MEHIDRGSFRALTGEREHAPAVARFVARSAPEPVTISDHGQWVLAKQHVL